MKKLILCLILCLVLCAASAGAVEYESDVFGQAVIFDVKPIFPGMGVMVVTVDGEWLCNIGWWFDAQTEVYNGKDGGAFTINGDVLTLYSPAYWVFVRGGWK